MKMLHLTLLLMPFLLSGMAVAEEPQLVNAVVRELTHDQNSPPLEFRNMAGKQPPSWIVRLEILQVFRGDPKLKGQPMITATADSEPEGNGRFVTPRLNEGDVGIWAIKRLADGSWAQVYTPYEVEKGVRLPLIKGRHETYEEVLLRLSGEAPQLTSDVKSQAAPTEVLPATLPPQSVQPPTPQQLEAKPSSTTPSEEPSSSTPWSIIVVLIVAAGGLQWLLFKRRS